MKTLDVISVVPEIVAAKRYDGTPDGVRLTLTVSMSWCDARGMHVKMQLGHVSFRLPPFVSGTVELAWPYIEGSTFKASDLLGGNPPPTDSLSSSSEEKTWQR